MTLKKSVFLQYTGFPDKYRNFDNNFKGCGIVVDGIFCRGSKKPITMDDIKLASQVHITCGIPSDNGLKIAHNFLCFDFDCKGKNALLRDESVSYARSLHEILGHPSPAVIQRSKSGNGVHLLIKVDEKGDIFTKNGKKWITDPIYKQLFGYISMAFPVDSGVLTANHLACLAAVDVGDDGFLCIEHHKENKPFKLNETILLAVKNLAERRKTKLNVEELILRCIDKIAGSNEGERNNVLYAQVKEIFRYSWIAGFEEQLILNKIYEAAESNGIISDDGESSYQATVTSAITAGKQEPRNIDEPIEMERSDRDIIYNPEIDLERSLVKEILKRLDKSIYYMVDSELFWDCDSKYVFSSFREAMTNSGIRIYETGKKKQEIKRVARNDSIISHVLSGFNPALVEWDRHIKHIISRPTYFKSDTETEGRMISTSGHNSECGVYSKVPCKTQDLKLADVLKGYSFMSDRSKVYAVVAMLAAFGSYYWGYRKPAFYYYALSDAGKNSGKTTLATMACRIRSDEVSIISYDGSQSGMAEMQKKILGDIKEGMARSILIDNLPSHKNQFRWAVLDAWLTQKKWSQRILGRSESFEIENTLFYAMTGNQCKLSDDLMARSAVIVFENTFDRHIRYKELDLDNAGLNLSYTISKYFQHWVEKGSPKGSKELPEDISSMIKYPAFWEDIAGLLEVVEYFEPGLCPKFGELSTYEALHLSSGSDAYKEVLAVIRSGDKLRGSAEEIHTSCKYELKGILFGSGQVDRLNRILLDFANRGLNGVRVDGHMTNGDPIFSIEEMEETKESKE